MSKTDHTVRIFEERLFPGMREYIVLVDGQSYDRMTAGKPWLRRDDMRDICAGYKEALDNYVSPSVQSSS